MLRLKVMLVLGLLVALSLVGFTQAQTTGSRPPEIAAAKNELGQRLHVDPANLELMRVEGRCWRDASLDCPAPGVAYARVATPGYYILLRDGEDVYEYHSDLHGRVEYCSRNIVSPHEMRPLADAARMRLAAQLGCAPAAVTLAEVPFSDFAPTELGIPYTPDWIKFDRQQPGDLPLLNCGECGEQIALTNDVVERNVGFVTEVQPVSCEPYRMAYMAPAQHLDGFNLWDLVVLDSQTDESHVVVCNVSDFSVAPGCGRVVFLRRIAGGMVLGGLETREVQLLKAPDFRGLSWDGTGRRYSAWSRVAQAGAWQLEVGEWTNAPKVMALPASLEARGLPQSPMWQGDMMAFTFEGGRVPRTFLFNAATSDGHPMPDGRFAGWLDAPGEYLRLSGNQLIHDSCASDYHFTVVATIPGVVWARPLPGCTAYVALTQEGGQIRLWTAPVVGQRAPRLVSEMMGEFVRGQVSDSGGTVLVQDITPVASNRRECRVTVVSLPDGQQEPLSGMCPRAQLLPSVPGQVTVGFPGP